MEPRKHNLAGVSLVPSLIGRNRFTRVVPFLMFGISVAATTLSGRVARAQTISTATGPGAYMWGRLL